VYIGLKLSILLSLLSLMANCTNAWSSPSCLGRVFAEIQQNFHGNRSGKADIRINEFVKIVGTSPDSAILSYPVLTKNGDGFSVGYKITFHRDTVEGKLPVLARVVSISDGKAVVEWKHLRSGFHEYLQVPLQELESLPVGGQLGFHEKLVPLLNLDLKLTAGESARFRDSQGRMQTGIIRAMEHRMVLIEAKMGGTQWVSEVDVFKANAGKATTAPNTPNYRDQLVPELAGYFPGEGFDSPRGAYRDLLNAAAKLNSSLLTQGASEESIARAMVNFLNMTVESNTYGWGATDFGATSIAEIICIGGVCRHKSRIIASILSELGLKPKIMFADEALIKQTLGQQSGHEWVEVDLSTSSERTETYVIDPMHPDRVFPLSKSVNQPIKPGDSSKVKIHGVYRSPLRVERYH
jgi:hypothetical protein